MCSNGNQTLLTDAAITTKNLCVKTGSDELHVAVSSSANDIPLGICPDEASAAEKYVPVYLFGAHEGTMTGVANANIANGAMLVSAGNGKLQTLPAAPGTYYIIGRALEASLAGGDVRFAHSFPVQRIVSP